LRFAVSGCGSDDGLDRPLQAVGILSTPRIQLGYTQESDELSAKILELGVCHEKPSVGILPMNGSNHRLNAGALSPAEPPLRTRKNFAGPA
jgi:hypothetical protein